MSWAIPFGNHDDNLILDRDAINDVLARYAWESSYLNEQNWDYGSASQPLLDTVSDNGQLADDFALTLYVTRGGGTAIGTVDPYTPGGNEANLVESTSWEEVDGMGRDITTRGGNFLVFATFQLKNLVNDYGKPGHFFTIGINDSPQVEALVGSGDTSNEDMFFKAYRVPFGATSNPLEGATLGGAYTAYSGTSPGIKANQIGITTHWAGYLPPGEHRISLMSRSVYQSGTSETDYITIRNLIIVETNDRP